MTTRQEIGAVRKELTEIAQAYNGCGMAILNRLYPGGYASVGRMPGALRPLEYTRSLLERLMVLEERERLAR